MTALINLCILFFTSTIAYGNTFEAGVMAFNEGNYENASKNFYELSEKHPNNPDLLLNLGLSSYKLGRRGLALGLWRKARYLQSTPQNRSAIAFVEDELGMGRNSGAFLSRSQQWFARQSLELWYGLTLALTLLIGWPMTTYFAKRKLPLPQWPPWIFVLIPIWFLFFGVGIWQTWTQREALGTIVYSDISTRTSPSLEAPTLTSLDEGSLVQILKVHENWFQIQTPSGVPGWVLAEKIILEKGS